MLPVFRYKVIVTGDSNTGKTSLIYKHNTGSIPNDITSTIGIDFMPATIQIGSVKVRLNIWDTAGQEKFGSIVRAYYRGAQGCFVVFDLSNPHSFNIEKWIADVVAEAGAVPIVVIGNKVDKISEERRRELQGVFEKKAEQFGVVFIMCSAVDGTNVVDAFRKMAEKLKDVNVETIRKETSRRGRCCN